MNGAKVCMIISIRNDRHLEAVEFYIECCKTDTIYTDRSFLNDQVHEFGWYLKPVFPTATLLFNLNASSRCVNMPLNQMSIQPPVDLHTSFEIYQVTVFASAKISF